MDVVNLKEFEESFVIHFGGNFQRINAYTLASTLVSFADAAKSANLVVNPGYEIEVVVEALGSGSFKAKLKAVYSGLNNLFTNQTSRTIVLSIMASYIYQQTLAPDDQVNVIVDETQVVIEQREKTIIIPREVHDAMKQVEKSEDFKKNISRTIESVEKDEQIEYIGIAKDLDEPNPRIEIPRSSFSRLTITNEQPDNSKSEIEIAELQIKRAILVRSRRRWEFVWRGVTISAPVLDSQFYDDFFAHRITIAPGDSLKVKLKIYQSRDRDTGIYTNSSYEVVEVIEHKPKQITARLM